MLGTTWHDERVAGGEDYIAVAKLDGEGAVNDQKSFVLVIVRMPPGRTNAFGNFEQATVPAPSRLPHFPG
ncbi:Uncharacterised protein [Mycobacteroides abscessus]|nr:hypothetical protein [Mycobacteroides abscessus]CPT91733.1 Uncharacterised protein [Mycobacteroides abscessus]CPW10820.1 Uncharacterised protein [Mycobacteroides abscessus]CQA07785.1 Uncharacterised protein [Mycobacteroides abscessus]SLH44090.1 Uncharacterised protein [Mycobacteroides abscessus subsp. massiliense]